MRTSLGKPLRGLWRRLARRRATLPAPAVPRQERLTGQGNWIDVDLIRGFLKRALEDEAVADPVNDLLFDHVVAGHHHPSTVARNLASYIDEILGAATLEDWQAVADELISEAREMESEG